VNDTNKDRLNILLPTMIFQISEKKSLLFSKPRIFLNYGGPQLQTRTT